jgi:hypothetical protein
VNSNCSSGQIELESKINISLAHSNLVAASKHRWSGALMNLTYLIGKWSSAVKERNLEKKVGISSQNAKASPHRQRERKANSAAIK